MGSLKSRTSDTGNVVVVRSNFCRVGEEVFVSKLWDSEGVRMEIVGSKREYVGDGRGREEDICLDLEGKGASKRDNLLGAEESIGASSF